MNSVEIAYKSDGERKRRGKKRRGNLNTYM